MYTFNDSHMNLISIAKFEYGWTQNIEIKIGRKLYLMDVRKDSGRCLVEVYRKLNKDRKKYSKFNPQAEYAFVNVKNDAVLDRRFFENVHEIARAQSTYSMYRNILKF